jgi:hypothetical protein
MTDRELMQMARDALVHLWDGCPADEDLILELNDRLAQPELNSELKVVSTGVTHIYSTGAPDAIQYDKDGNEMAHWKFRSFAPPQREWQWLTDEEIGAVIADCQITLVNYCSEDKQTEFARAIEAKLKAKNNA